MRSSKNRKRTKLILAGGLTLALCGLSGALDAQTKGKGGKVQGAGGITMQKRVRDCPDGRELARREDEKRQLRGEIVALKTVEVRGASIKNAVALVATRSTHLVVVDLGPAKLLPRKSLKVGAKLRVEGRVEVIRGRQFVVADRIVLAGAELSIERSAQTLLLKKKQQALRQQYQQQQRPQPQPQPQPQPRNVRPRDTGERLYIEEQELDEDDASEDDLIYEYDYVDEDEY